ncbi:protein of unknown function [Xenorhabdus doucetiae]|uniref:Uncharacterized protein n=1 Tax=Xenorhabdus doucetiae TaxID=351671 RepID=A0A068QSP5_9GAMM|nr:protein of unknown function [Xenorhabdus doucetiae]
MAINQIAKIGLSSLQVIYYFENLFMLDLLLTFLGFLSKGIFISMDFTCII